MEVFFWPIMYFEGYFPHLTVCKGVIPFIPNLAWAFLLISVYQTSDLYENTFFYLYNTTLKGLNFSLNSWIWLQFMC